MGQRWPPTRSRTHARHAAPAPSPRIWPAAAAIAIAVLGVAGVLVATLSSVGEAEPTAVRAAQAPPAAIAPPAAVAPSQLRESVAAQAPPSARPRPTPVRKAKSPTTTAAECNRIAARSSMPNARLGPYLRSLGCNATADALLVGPAGPSTPQRTAVVNPGATALQACREQTG